MASTRVLFIKHLQYRYNKNNRVPFQICYRIPAYIITFREYYFLCAAVIEPHPLVDRKNLPNRCVFGVFSILFLSGMSHITYGHSSPIYARRHNNPLVVLLF